MSMSTQEVKDIKNTLTQILQNQTAIMAQLVMLNRQNNAVSPPNTPTTPNFPIAKGLLEGLKAKLFNSGGNNPAMNAKMQQEMLMGLLKANGSTSATNPTLVLAPPPLKRVKKELPLENIGNGDQNNDNNNNQQHRRSHHQRKPEEGGTGQENAKPEGKMVKKEAESERFCVICKSGVGVHKLVDHIWEHIKRKVESEKGANTANMHSFLCEAKGCQFRTNKLMEAKAHAKAMHPEMESDKLMVDNTENTSSIFQLVLAECFGKLEPKEKEMIMELRFH